MKSAGGKPGEVGAGARADAGAGPDPGAAACGSTITVIVDEGSRGQRLDVFIARAAGLPSRHFAHRLLQAGMVTRADARERPTHSACKPSSRVEPGQTYAVTVPEPEPTDVVGEPIPLDVVYEDSDIVVVNKPRGLVVHPAAGNPRHTLVNALLWRCPDLSGMGGKERPGIVHRLDKDTSGLIVVAKNDRAHTSLAEQIRTKHARRDYVAVVHGLVGPDEGTVDLPIGRHRTLRKQMAVVTGGGSRAARTTYRVLERAAGHSVVEVTLHTGRTHQIRVHMAHIGYPVAGDKLYGAGRGLARCRFCRSMSGQALHAARLTLRHPSTGEVLRFEAPLPADMSDLISSLKEAEA